MDRIKQPWRLHGKEVQYKNYTEYRIRFRHTKKSTATSALVQACHETQVTALERTDVRLLGEGSIMSVMTPTPHLGPLEVDGAAIPEDVEGRLDPRRPTVWRSDVHEGRCRMT